MHKPIAIKRVNWIDTLKGVTIILVVLHHTTLGTQTWLALEKGFYLPELLWRINAIFANFRMPAFFFCSGIIFNYASQKGTKWVVDKRILGSLWIILFWTIASYIFESGGVLLYPWAKDTMPLADAFWSPFGNLWFMYALMICSVSAYILRSAHFSIQIIISLFLSFVFGYFIDQENLSRGWGNTIRGLSTSGFFFFISGFSFGLRALKIIEDNKSCIMVLILNILISIFFYKLGNRVSLPEIFRSTIPSTIIFICFIRLFSDYSNLFRIVFSFIGKRSLNIFVTHQFLIASVIYIWSFSIVGVYPIYFWLTVAIFGTVGTIILQYLVEKLTSGLAYRPPNWLKTNAVPEFLNSYAYPKKYK